MALLTFNEVRKKYNEEHIKRSQNTTFSLESLNEACLIDSTKVYDIFLSHSSLDNKDIEGTKWILEEYGYSVYVDIYDKFLNPNIVTKQTADLLKQRMQNCKTLIYAFSENSPFSSWMPWELGYFDGLKGRAAVLPLVEISKENYQGTEYVGLYHHIQFGRLINSRKKVMYVKDNNKYQLYDQWLSPVDEPFKSFK